jgi:hypothetical protein
MSKHRVLLIAQAFDTHVPSSDATYFPHSNPPFIFSLFQEFCCRQSEFLPSGAAALAAPAAALQHQQIEY